VETWRAVTVSTSADGALSQRYRHADTTTTEHEVENDRNLQVCGMTYFILITNVWMKYIEMYRERVLKGVVNHLLWRRQKCIFDPLVWYCTLMRPVTVGLSASRIRLIPQGSTSKFASAWVQVSALVVMQVESAQRCSEFYFFNLRGFIKQ